jgi:hypothetical protein
METITSSWVKKAEGKPGNGDRLIQSKVKLFGISGNSGIKAGTRMAG